MSNIVSFSKGRVASLGTERPVIVTVTDRDGSVLFSCPMLPPEEGASTLAPSDPVDIAFVKAVLQHALRQLEAPENDPEIGSDYVPT
jgi:hypothetical protein